jgi:hypothetical protein
MNEAVTTTQEIIEMITEAGLDHHDFKCQAAANRIAAGDNAWEQIAQMARGNIGQTAWLRAWELSGVPIPEEYLDDEAAA